MMFIYETPKDPAVATAAGGEATFAEVFAASRDLMWFVDNSNASALALEEAYDRRIDAVRAATGIQLDNPMRARPEAPDPRDIRPTGIERRPAIDRQRADFDRRLAEIARQHPHAAEAIRAGVPVDDDAAAIAREAAERYGRFVSSRRDLLGKWTAALAGGVFGALRDPLQVASLFAGAGPGAARTIAGRILVQAGREAAINGTVEAALQPAVQAWREKAGLDHGILEAARNVAFAAGLGAGFGGILQGGIEAARPLLRGRGLDTAAAAAARALPEDTPARRVLAGEARADEAAELVRPVREALPAEARGAIDAIDADRIVAAQRPAGVDPDAHDLAAAQAIRFAEDPDANPPPPDTRGQGLRFHGSMSDDLRLNNVFGNEQNFYGIGFYTTEALDVAIGYARRKNQVGTVFQVEARDVPTLDMEQPVPAWLVKGFEDGREFDLPSQEALNDLVVQALAQDPPTVRALYDEIRALSGEHGVSAAEVQEFIFEEFKERMLAQGFRAMRHDGGGLTGTRGHEVTIYFAPEDDVSVTPLMRADERPPSDIPAGPRQRPPEGVDEPGAPEVVAEAEALLAAELDEATAAMAVPMERVDDLGNTSVEVRTAADWQADIARDGDLRALVEACKV